MKYLLTFRRRPMPCDMAEVFCQVERHCTECDDYFNAQPLRVRIAVEVPRRWDLLIVYGWRAALRGIATDEEFEAWRRNG